MWSETQLWSMKKLLTVICLCLSLSVLAQDNEGISLKTYVEYGYNYTWEHYGSLSVIGNFPINSHFELEAGLNTNSANIYALNVKSIVKFPLKVGQLKLENRYLYNMLLRNNSNDFCGALSIGYYINHLSVSAGFFARLYGNLVFDSHEGSVSTIIEPFNLIYSIEGQLFKQDHLWNLGARISNHNDFTIERFNEPIFTLLGIYKATNSIKLFTEISCKPSGIFHVTANFYSIFGHIGFIYKW